MMRRLMYLKHILNTDHDGLLYKFYKIQKDCSVKNDWIKQIDLDKAEINLNLTDEQILVLPKRKFKKFLRNKIYSAATIYLNSIAKKHSKSTPLVKSKLKCEKYINDKRFTQEEVRLLFKLRTRMYPVKANFKKKHMGNLSCEFCVMHNSDQQHLLQFTVLRKFVPELSNSKVEYDDIFGSVDKQLRAVKLFSKLTKQRKILIEALSI